MPRVHRNHPVKQPGVGGRHWLAGVLREARILRKTVQVCEAPATQEVPEPFLSQVMQDFIIQQYSTRGALLSPFCSPSSSPQSRIARFWPRSAVSLQIPKSGMSGHPQAIRLGV